MEHQRPIDTFTRDIDIVSVTDFEFDSDKGVLDEIKSSIASTGILLLGEIHGVRENPSIIKTIMSTFGIKRLALEWDGALGDIAARYVATGIFTMDTPSNRDDGRFTSGHLALIRDLSRDGQLDDLICIDREEHGANWQDRDRIMANEVIRHTGDPLLVVAGNLHTRLEEQNLDDEFPHFQPMGSFLKEKFPELTTIKITYGSGSYMNIGLQTFVDSHVSDASYLSKIGKEEFSFSIPYAHPAILPDK